MSNWRTEPISRTCEMLTGRIGAKDQFCGKETFAAYKAMGCGWMALCREHAKKHLSYAEPIQTLIAKGETFK